jgi:hypothetical protein
VFKPPLPTRGSEHNAGGKVALSQWEKTTMPALETGATADPLEKALGIQRGKAFDMPVALRGANPNFSKGKEFQFNCQRCVPAYELRRRGYDVEAMPVASKNFGMVKRGDECFKDVKITGWPEDRKGLSETGLRARLETLPDGARVGVFVQWNKSSAHTFVCEKANGSLRFIDPQTGKACPEYLTQGKKFGYYRMDTLTLQEHIDWKTAIKAVPNDETGSKKYS